MSECGEGEIHFILFDDIDDNDDARKNVGWGGRVGGGVGGCIYIF